MSELAHEFSPDSILVRDSPHAAGSLTSDSQSRNFVIEARRLTRLYAAFADSISSVYLPKRALLLHKAR